MKNRLLQVQQVIFTIIFVVGMIYYIRYSQFIAWGFMFFGWGAFIFTDVWAGGLNQDDSFAFYWVNTISVFLYGFSSILSESNVLERLTYKGEIITYITWGSSGIYLFYIIPKFQKWSRDRRERRIKKLEALNKEMAEFTKNWIGGWDEEHSRAWSKLQSEISKLSTGWMTPESP